MRASPRTAASITLQSLLILRENPNFKIYLNSGELWQGINRVLFKQEMKEVTSCNKLLNTTLSNLWAKANLPLLTHLLTIMGHMERSIPEWHQVWPTSSILTSVGQSSISVVRRVMKDHQLMVEKGHRQEYRRWLLRTQIYLPLND